MHTSPIRVHEGTELTLLSPWKRKVGQAAEPNKLHLVSIKSYFWVKSQPRLQVQHHGLYVYLTEHVVLIV
jgi:hypothetical protein